MLSHQTHWKLVTGFGLLFICLGAAAAGATLQVEGRSGVLTLPMAVNVAVTLFGVAATYMGVKKLSPPTAVAAATFSSLPAAVAVGKTGTYTPVTVSGTGNVTIPGTGNVTVPGSLTLAPGAVVSNPTNQPVTIQCGAEIVTPKQARQAFDILLWHLHTIGRFEECEAAANTFQKAIYGGEKKNESSVQPNVAPAPVAPAPVEKPADIVAGVVLPDASAS